MSKGTGVTRLSAFRARVAGASARRAQQPVTDCPFKASGTWRQRTLARYWTLGWLRADAVLRDSATQAP